MPQTSFAVMTTVGRAKEAAALANATTINITHIAIGDGATVPSGGETALYNEVARKTISGSGTVVGASNVAYFDCYLAAAEGPYTIREAGIYDVEGDLIAIAHYDPPINKPVPSSGQTVEGTVRLEVAFSDVASVVITIDPTLQVALQRLSRLPWIPIIELNLNTPPTTPTPGDAYVIGPAPTGSWAGQAGKVAEYTSAGWAIITPPAGHGVSLPDGRVYELVSGTYVEKIALDVQSGKWIYAAAGGTADVLTATLEPVPAAYVAGMAVRLKIGTTNTGAATLNVNGLGAKSIVRGDGIALTAGDLVAGEIVSLVYDGTNFRLISSVISQIQNVSGDAFKQASSEMISNMNGTTLADNVVTYVTRSSFTDDGQGDFVTSGTTGIQCVRAGRYVVCGSFSIQLPSSPSVTFALSSGVRKNASEFMSTSIRLSTENLNTSFGGATMIVDLAAGDVLQAWAYSDADAASSGGSRTVNIQSAVTLLRLAVD